MKRPALAVALVTVALAGCGETIDSTPERLDGSQSQEFEDEDIERAEDASDAEKDYWAGAVSEASASRANRTSPTRNFP